ncbi:MAG: hypothetical protein EA378_01440 [Phycisphaerales bacterium]|nr:MAG: hypothetical protein EA378_01440 [Phycisphaerales bacterium]
MPETQTPAPEPSCRPSPTGWPTLVREHFNGATSAQAAARASLRAEFGLPIDRPVVLSGHQPGLWHPGILAKRFALTALAERTNAGSAWLVVDHDADDAGVLRIPVRTPGHPGGIDARAIRLAPDDAARPLGLRPAIADLSAMEDAIERGLGELIPGRLEAIADALRAHAGAASLADQLARTGEDLLPPEEPRVTLLSSLALGRTTLFQELVEKMRAEPEACRGSYNGAIEGVGPGPGIRALAPGEFPLWILRDNRRLPATGERLRGLGERDALAPRGLLMTGLVRFGACDLFIHGTGGGGSGANQPGYDRVTERWLEAWLGWARLAPAVVATATVLLEFPGPSPPIPTEADLARARWRAHHAAHDPAMLGDGPLAERKRAHVRAIEAAADPGERATRFRAMHELLAENRRAHASALAELRATAERLQREREASGLRADRAWSFALHPPRALSALRVRTGRAFEGASGGVPTRAARYAQPGVAPGGSSDA